ncbi:MAG TPA: low specificity L-threonine aldolase [Thermoanaerobaculia bacterium]|nr:low specificity L-threonine aldolase [Thermoanaerobaculia bacterium]
MMIDLRSDTVTKPDAEMRRAMAEAEVGDDVYGEDPTVARLEEESAAALGFEASVFVPSGTMGNQIAMHLHGRPGEEVICDALSHVFRFEMGGMAALSGLIPRVIPSPRGLLDPVEVEAVIDKDVTFHARTGMICVENTHNIAGGVVYDRDRLDRLVDVARRNELPIHLDGARIFNAAVALGTTVPALTAGFDSAMFCLSKGLGAPIGSMLCGPRPFIREARRVRKMFGGGMRQVGVIAAAGLVALRKGPGRLAEDHENAGRLARALAELPGIEIDPALVQTNILVCRISHDLGFASGFLARLQEAGVLGSQVSADQARFVTHRDVGRAQVDEAIEKIRRVADRVPA